MIFGLDDRRVFGRFVGFFLRRFFIFSQIVFNQVKHVPLKAAVLSFCVLLGSLG